MLQLAEADGHPHSLADLRPLAREINAASHAILNRVAETGASASSEINAWRTFWKAVRRFDRSKIRPRIAIRNTVGVVLPLAILGAMGQHALALIGSLGALNVAYSDGEDGYGMRARRMLLASFFVALALFAGGLTGRHHALAILVAALWAFCAGMLVALSTTAGDIGTVSLVTLVVFASRPLKPEQAAISGLVALAGALLQTGLSLLFWPVRRGAQEQEVVRGVYAELRGLATTQVSAGTAPLGTAKFIQARQSLAVQERSVEWERLNVLLSQAERIRLRLLTIGRLRRRLSRDPDGQEAAETLDRFAGICAALMGDIEASLGRGPRHSAESAARLREAERMVESLRALDASEKSDFLRALVRDATTQSYALTGQIRAARRMADREEFAPVIPARRRGAAIAQARDTLQGQMTILRANLSIRSVAFRHALRLAVCVAVGDAIGRGFDWQRSYWIPMTIAIVLKPDFLSTFSRGVLRLGGTLVGLTVATVLYAAVPPRTLTDVIYVGAFTLMLRWVGPANYGIFVIAVSGLVVALIANTGIAPQQVIPLRALNTTIGGVLALIAYAVWPTWERSHAGEFLGRLLDCYRDYLRLVRREYIHPDAADVAALDRARQSARVARSNVEASMERLRMEPGATVELLHAYGAMLASSHDFIYAVMTLEGGATEEQPAAAPELRQFLDQVELTLYYLASAIRGGAMKARDWPDLREQHRLLSAALTGEMEHSLVRVETDRMTNALNSFREQLMGWLDLRKKR